MGNTGDPLRGYQYTGWDWQEGQPTYAPKTSMRPADWLETFKTNLADFLEVRPSNPGMAGLIKALTLDFIDNPIAQIHYSEMDSDPERAKAFAYLVGTLLMYHGAGRVIGKPVAALIDKAPLSDGLKQVAMRIGSSSATFIGPALFRAPADGETLDQRIEHVFTAGYEGALFGMLPGGRLASSAGAGALGATFGWESPVEITGSPVADAFIFNAALNSMLHRPQVSKGQMATREMPMQQVDALMYELQSGRMKSQIPAEYWRLDTSMSTPGTARVIFDTARMPEAMQKRVEAIFKIGGQKAAEPTTEEEVRVVRPTDPKRATPLEERMSDMTFEEYLAEMYGSDKMPEAPTEPPPGVPTAADFGAVETPVATIAKGQAEKVEPIRPTAQPIRPTSLFRA